MPDLVTVDASMIESWQNDAELLAKIPALRMAPVPKSRHSCHKCRKRIENDSRESQRLAVMDNLRGLNSEQRRYLREKLNTKQLRFRTLHKNGRFIHWTLPL